MLTIFESEKALLAFLPKGSVVKGRTTIDNLHLFIAHTPDPLEGTLDPFYSVNARTKEIRDFSPQDYPDPLSVIKRLNRPTN